jgi:hypothetical protein
MLTLTGKPFVTSRTGEVGSGQARSDEALIGAIAAGDRRAMQALYARHNVRIYRFVLRLTTTARWPRISSARFSSTCGVGRRVSR